MPFFAEIRRDPCGSIYFNPASVFEGRKIDWEVYGYRQPFKAIEVTGPEEFKTNWRLILPPADNVVELNDSAGPARIIEAPAGERKTIRDELDWIIAQNAIVPP